MKKTSGLFLAVLLVAFSACKSSKEEEAETGQKESFFPVLSFLKSQVAQVDTSLNSIRQYINRDSSAVDTIYVPREQFRGLAKDFLDLPDLSSPEYQKRYREEKQFDETLNRVLIQYIPVNAEKEEILRQEVLIKPDIAGDKITTIIISRVNNTKDSLVRKQMLWRADESFQVVTTKKLPGQPETTTTTKVVWSEEQQ